MSESTDLVRELLAGGMNYADVGRALGRDRSLIRQVGVGAKPGNNLRAALEGLRDRLAGVQAAVPAPTRRTTARGKPARTRAKTVHGDRAGHERAYSTGIVKKQGARSGGGNLTGALARAADAGRTVSVTVSFDRAVTVDPYKGSKKGVPGPGGTLDMQLGDAEEVQEGIAEHGSLTAYVCAYGAAQGWLYGPPDLVSHVNSLELRTY
jgi:hypothetical protein